MFDTWAKIPSGLLHGNLQNPGHFTDCVKFRHVDVKGQHCMVPFRAMANKTFIRSDNFDWREVGNYLRANKLTFENGFCLPATCSKQKVIDYANIIFMDADLETWNASCRTNDPIEFKALDIFTM